MGHRSFAGVHTALVTPFAADRVDRVAFRRLIDANFAGGVAGVVPCGTTGESPTLSHEEHNEVVALAVEYAQGRGHVMAGTGSNSTKEAISLTQEAEKKGATASLQVAPYYNKPSQEGLYQHFKAIAQETNLPIMLYNVPGRSGVEIGVETCVRLAHDCKNIVAIKEASGSVDRVSQLVTQCPEGFEVLSGDDSLTLAFMSAGAVGVVSVASNLVPREMCDLVAAALAGRYEEAKALHRKYNRLFSAFLKMDTNPIPIKTAMELAGRCSGELRLPLVPTTMAKREELAKTLKEMGIIS